MDGKSNLFENQEVFISVHMNRRAIRKLTASVFHVHSDCVLLAVGESFDALPAISVISCFREVDCVLVMTLPAQIKLIAGVLSAVNVNSLLGKLRLLSLAASKQSA